MGPYEYIVETIAGDYATDIGTRLHWENFAYTIVD